MKYFVSSDIHGFYSEWMSALKDAGFDEGNPSHHTIVCGDLFDRGRQPEQIIKFVHEMNELGRIVLVKGNHEYLMEKMIDRGIPHWVDYSNGTLRTLKDLGWDEFGDDSMYDVYEKSGLKSVINLCKDYHSFCNEKYICVHGWFPNKGETWEQASWKNPVSEFFDKKNTLPGSVIICGHWHVSDFWKRMGKEECYDTFVSEGIVALDACTPLSGKVNVYVIDDSKGDL